MASRTPGFARMRTALYLIIPPPLSAAALLDRHRPADDRRVHGTYPKRESPPDTAQAPRGLVHAWGTVTVSVAPTFPHVTLTVPARPSTRRSIPLRPVEPSGANAALVTVQPDPSSATVSLSPPDASGATLTRTVEAPPWRTALVIASSTMHCKSHPRSGATGGTSGATSHDTATARRAACAAHTAPSCSASGASASAEDTCWTSLPKICCSSPTVCLMSSATSVNCALPSSLSSPPCATRFESAEHGGDEQRAVSQPERNPRVPADEPLPLVPGAEDRTRPLNRHIVPNDH